MSTITLRTKSPGLLIIWTWVGEGPAKTFDAVNNLLAASKNGGYALLNRGPHHYEYGEAILTIYLSTAYRGTRCKIIPTKHN